MHFLLKPHQSTIIALSFLALNANQPKATQVKPKAIIIDSKKIGDCGTIQDTRHKVEYFFDGSSLILTHEGVELNDSSDYFNVYVTISNDIIEIKEEGLNKNHLVFGCTSRFMIKYKFKIFNPKIYTLKFLENHRYDKSTRLITMIDLTQPNMGSVNFDRFNSRLP